jgi:hypothetical protein
MTPPPLTSVGDKLHDGALRDAIRRAGAPHRPYLLVRMPRFGLSDDELSSLVDRLIAEDRIPAGAPRGSLIAGTQPGLPGGGGESRAAAVLDAVGSRLVTPDGFGCTSCHQIGSVIPVKAPPNARGPTLSLLSQRIRREWFDRWVRNPARIVPRMEMPSVQVAVRGVLGDNVDTQLAAVWDVLNRPGFEPPEPNPVRTVRQTGARPENHAEVISDVLRTKHGIYVKPLLIGLANRHNVLFDLETARLAAWSIGDAARQRTEGKTWYWESAGKDLYVPAVRQSEFSLGAGGQLQTPRVLGQFVTEFEELVHAGAVVRFRHRLHFGSDTAPSRAWHVTQEFMPLPGTDASPTSGFRRVVEIEGIEPGAEAVLRLSGGESSLAEAVSPDGKLLRLAPAGDGTIAIRLAGPASARILSDGTLRAAAESGQRVRWELEYLTDFPVDRFPIEPILPLPARPMTLQVVPGFTAVRLPLSDEIMPTGLAWRPDGTLVIASLKGQVWLAYDVDGDGLAERLHPFSDELAAPYGLFAAAEYIDVINKYALLRLFDTDGDGRADRTVAVASGWGHTTDYHDWAVGLPRDEQGRYYVGIPCQQDQRTAAAAQLRGTVVRLVPRSPTADDRPAAVPGRDFIAGAPVSDGNRAPGQRRRICDGQSGQLQPVQRAESHPPWRSLRIHQRDRKVSRAACVADAARDQYSASVDPQREWHLFSGDPGFRKKAARPQCVRPLGRASDRL